MSINDLIEEAFKRYDLDSNLISPEALGKKIRRTLKDKYHISAPYRNLDNHICDKLLSEDLVSYLSKKSESFEKRDSIKKDQSLMKKSKNDNYLAYTAYMKGKPFPNNGRPLPEGVESESLSSLLDEYNDSLNKPTAIESLRACKNKATSEDWQMTVNWIDKKLTEFKSDFIFQALLELTNKEFDQKSYISDLLHMHNLIDPPESTRGIPVSPVPKKGYSFYAQKISNPFENYIKNKNNSSKLTK